MMKSAARACARGKAIGLSVYRYHRWYCRRHEIRHTSPPRHLCVLQAQSIDRYR